MDPLLRSYRNTTYRVIGVTPEIDIRIDAPCPMLDALLLRRAVSCWAFITAWNPMSRPLPLSENRERAARLAHVHDDIVAMPGGYQRPAGEAGGNLSGGQQQRVAIARALVHEPRLVICDEPTSALDKDTGAHIMDLLRAVARHPERSVIVVTHDNRIFKYADRLTEMEDGRVQRVHDQAGNIDEIGGAA